MKRTIFVIMAMLSVFAMIMSGCDSGSQNASGKYTVNFETNGGGKIDALTDVPSGTKITEPEAPAKANFTFGGWYKDTEFKSEWTFNSDKVTKDTTLYANWTKNNPDTDPDDSTKKNYFVVTFMDGETTVNTYDIAYGEKITAPVVDPVRTGFYFDGWYDGETQAAKKWSFANKTVTADTTLYTKFSAVTNPPYTVRFSNEGKLHKVISGLAEGAKITAPDKPEKEDYVFDAWYKEEDFINKWVFATDTVTRNLFLYARFTPVVDDPPEDVARAEVVTLANAWYVVYCFELPDGKSVSDYAELRAYYTLTKTQLKNGVARGARLYGPYPQDFFQMCMGSQTGTAPGKGLAIASFNLANDKFILDNPPSSQGWGKEANGKGDSDDGIGTLKTALLNALGYTPDPGEWFTLSYDPNGSRKHENYGKDVAYQDGRPLTIPTSGKLFYGVGLPGQGKSGTDYADFANTFYVRDVKLKVEKGEEKTSDGDIVGKPVYFVKGGYKYPAFCGYFNTNGSAGHKEASRESCDDLNPPIEIAVTWE